MIPFGARVRDRVSGLTGIAMARTEYHTGCVHVAIAREALSADGKVAEWDWFDESRVEVVELGACILSGEHPHLAAVGGPGQSPPTAAQHPK